MKRTSPNIQNMHENGVNHDDLDNHDISADHDDSANHDDFANHADNSLYIFVIFCNV